MPAARQADGALVLQFPADAAYTGYAEFGMYVCLYTFILSCRHTPWRRIALVPDPYLHKGIGSADLVGGGNFRPLVVLFELECTKCEARAYPGAILIAIDRLP